jgi:hypothetical protein
MPDDAPWAEPVVVPDDLRSLQADVDAYHREQRLAKRRRRLQRVTRTRAWQRFGLPASVLLGAMALAGTMFAALMFGQPHAQPVPVAAPLSADPPAEPGELHGLLPDVSVAVTGGTVDVRQLRPKLVALVPIGCDCPEILASLAAQADEVHIGMVAVAPAAQDAEVAALAGRLHRGQVDPAFDATGRLAAAYDAQGVLTVLGVAPDGTVGFVVRDVSADQRLESSLHLLVSSPLSVPAG